MKRADVTEAELAAVVVAWLEAMGADVYQEVTVGSISMDIVARVGAETWSIETKTSLSLALITQAMERRRLAHRVYVAAPPTRNAHDGEMLLREIGVGMLKVHVDEGDYSPARVTERCPSLKWNTRPVALTAALRPEHKTHAPAGTNGGGRWTPFRGTCNELARFVSGQPGVTLKDAVDGIRHHYSSSSCARSSLATWLKAGKVPGVRIDKRDGKATLWPTEAA